LTKLLAHSGKHQESLLLILTLHWREIRQNKKKHEFKEDKDILKVFQRSEINRDSKKIISLVVSQRIYGF